MRSNTDRLLLIMKRLIRTLLFAYFAALPAILVFSATTLRAQSGESEISYIPLLFWTLSFGYGSCDLKLIWNDALSHVISHLFVAAAIIPVAILFRNLAARLTRWTANHYGATWLMVFVVAVIVAAVQIDSSMTCRGTRLEPPKTLGSPGKTVERNGDCHRCLVIE